MLCDIQLVPKGSGEFVLGLIAKQLSSVGNDCLTPAASSAPSVPMLEDQALPAIEGQVAEASSPTSILATQ
eukprot:10392143-Alexandrium_andersonii.AAC.1